ncbi:WecB/TagA/CpsF family glycosyltransferase [Actimicrobium sp. CCC2.4]|uniref:WecB/TagA/CpsF family glycosyltransferase n=1 Tax=Actimicrobium sp. CCC2.4 TaxID=3048606 RepID=UPI002AC8C453|nr:WecB/TagA/CpsF family glycosyltransferase [Actimicrobium sp. CCC2.4]MEB0136037.1 WecB/TagA/CpsF family glycosyltransferase [Actimicrobium sp. CCC2.4]WPX32700.1 WecB/TagA/CpsF family glycosyltransferase [Actimicrobium sp. CCC2.4]
MDNQPIYHISQFPVLSTTRDQLADHLLERIVNHSKTVLFFANTNFIVKCRFVLKSLPDDKIVLVNDGIGMDIAAKLVLKSRFADNLNGTDFTPFLFDKAKVPLRVFLLGGRPEVTKRAAVHAEQVLGQNVVGFCDGYAGMRNTPDLVQKINAVKAQVVLVAMGNPMQEQWILDHRASLDANLLMGIGALFDFWSGHKKRAPAVVKRLRLEWLYRLYLEPRRLLRRYTWDILIFLRQCFKFR